MKAPIFTLGYELLGKIAMHLLDEDVLDLLSFSICSKQSIEVFSQQWFLDNLFTRKFGEGAMQQHMVGAQLTYEPVVSHLHQIFIDRCLLPENLMRVKPIELWRDPPETFVVTVSSGLKAIREARKGAESEQSIKNIRCFRSVQYDMIDSFSFHDGMTVTMRLWLVFRKIYDPGDIFPSFPEQPIIDIREKYKIPATRAKEYETLKKIFIQYFGEVWQYFILQTRVSNVTPIDSIELFRLVFL